MRSRYIVAIGGLALGAIAFYTGLNAGNSSANVADAERSNTIVIDNTAIDPALGDAIRNYLFQNPEIVEQSQILLAQRRETEQQEKTKAILAGVSEQFDNPALPVVGDRNAPITVVEFFDYNCGYCKRAMEDMEAILATNPDVKFVMQEFPILGPQSIEAHRVSAALQALKPEAYQEFHRRLLSFEGRADGATAMTVATSLGLSEEAITAEMRDPDNVQIFDPSYRLADQLAITGTPSYIIGDEVIFGAQGAEALMARIEKLRGQATN